MLAAFDPIVLIGPAIGVVGIAVSVYLWRRGRVRPALSYRLTSPPVVNVHREVEDRISVFYDKERVADARLLDLRVTNTGNVDISATDFEEPLSVALGTSARVLNRPRVGKTVPPELRPQVSVDRQDLVIAPLLLNAGDSFEVTVLVSELTHGDRLSLSARVAGVPKLINSGTESSQQQQTRSTVKTTQAYFMAVVSVIAVVYSLFIGPAPNDHSIVVLASGPRLCGDVLRVDANRIVVKLKDTGTLRSFSLAQTRAIRDKAC